MSLASCAHQQQIHRPGRQAWPGKCAPAPVCGLQQRVATQWQARDSPNRGGQPPAAAYTDSVPGVVLVRSRRGRTPKRQQLQDPVVVVQPQQPQQQQPATPVSNNAVTLAPPPQPSTALQQGLQQQPQQPQNPGPPGGEQEVASLPDAAWAEFEARLEADLQTVGVTLVAIVGVIVFWRGVWSLLDYLLGDNPIGDICCILVGFGIIMSIRLAGLKVGSFWPSG